MSTQPANPPGPVSGTAPGSEPILQARGVTMRFGGLTAVDGVDLDVAGGEIVGLIGPNGAGKTTFFNCLTGLYPPTAGSITFRGQRLAPKPYRVAEAGISRTFQNIRLFPNMTALENVMVGRHCRTREGLLSAIGRGPRYRAAEREARQTARELLSFLDLDRHASAIARSLPYGDQRKLEIARAMASDPGLLLLDEPAAGMNPRETLALRETIFKIRQRGLSVVVIEHDMRFIFNLCDRLVVLARGRKLTEGRPDEVRADERVIATYLGTAPAAAPGTAEQEASDAR
nr:ABC transporter ATP-binding protein [Catenulispora pinisilvae]